MSRPRHRVADQVLTDLNERAPFVLHGTLGGQQRITAPDTDSSIDENLQHKAIRLQSRLSGVSDEAWSQFVRCMMTGGQMSVSPSNALGLFEMMPRRLADLALVKNLRRTKSKTGRTIWCGTFIPPMTSGRFLQSPFTQYDVFSRSMMDYDAKMSAGSIDRPAHISRAGALALLHRAGPNALKTWTEGGARFSNTQALYDCAKELF